MKYCEFCDSGNEESVSVCISCGGNDFYHRCPACGKNMHGAIYCEGCGIRFDAEKRICPTCRKPYFGAKCLSCAETPPQAQAYQFGNTYSPANGSQPKSKTVALILCLLFGCLGAHKFYEGKFLSGVFYLCTFGFFGVGVLVDFFCLLAKPDPYYC